VPGERRLQRWPSESHHHHRCPVAPSFVGRVSRLPEPLWCPCCPSQPSWQLSRLCPSAPAAFGWVRIAIAARALLYVLLSIDSAMRDEVEAARLSHSHVDCPCFLFPRHPRDTQQQRR
jgi:hypothetical protein